MKKDVVLFIKKYSKREFLPSYIFDIPTYIYRFFLAIKSGNFLFFSNINPGMKFSGMAGYGKYDGLKKIKKELIPNTILCSHEEGLKIIEDKIKDEGIEYPFIAKPDLGRTGRDVKKIKNSKELKMYVENIKEDFLIQEYIGYPLEFGIFYYRMPGEDKGHITGIVKKTFMYIRGDGKTKFGDLVWNHPRAIYYYNQLKKDFSSERGNVVENGKEIQLNYLGNHVRGSVFYDSSDLITTSLEKLFDDISNQIGGFFFGRYDIKVENIEELYKGRFKILEVNGAGALPMHVYDPNYSLWKARSCFLYHWKLIYKISKANKKLGHKYTSISEALSIVRKYGI